jgi:aminoglycoside phosphotransferase (APT) family kinase protein
MRDEDRALLRGERALPGLALLLDDDAFAATLAERLPAAGIASAHGVYVRYQPGRGCLVVFRVQTAAGESLAYARAHRAGEEAALAAARLRGVPGSALGRSALVLAGPRVVVRSFPFDRRMRRLPDVVAGAGPLEVLGYRPERRAVLRARSGGLVLKVHRADRFASAAAAADALRAGGGLRLPRLVRAREHRGLLAYEWLDGRRLDALVAVGDGTDVAPALAAALAELHAQAPTALPVRRARVEAERLVAAAEATAVAGPATARSASRLAARLAGGLVDTSAASGAVHGNLSVDQVLVRRASIALLDLDEAAIGERASDLAACLADLELRVLDGRLDGEAAGTFGEALVDACRRDGLDVTEERIAALTAAALLRRATEPFRRRRPGWDGLVEAAVRRCEQLARKGSDPFVHLRRKGSDPFMQRNEVRGLTPHGGAGRLPPLLRALAVLPGWCGDDRAGAPALLLRRSWPRLDGRLLLEYAGAGGAVLGAQWLPPEVAGEDGGAAAANLAVLPCAAGGVLLLHMNGRDARLPGLRHVLGRRGAELLSHSPGRRAAVRLDGATFAKVVRPSRAAAATAAARFASRLVGRRFAVAEVRWCEPDLGLVATGLVPGRPFGSLLDAPEALPAALELGAALATLHAAPAPGWLPPHDAAAEARLVRAFAERAGRHVPEARAPLLARAAAAAGRLEHLPAVDPAPLHRDLHDGQVLVDGARVGLIDFDTLAAGDPALDVGNLLAHLDLRALQGSCAPARAGELASALLDGYGDGGVAARAAAYARAARVRLACVYALRPRWSHLWRPLSEGPGHAEGLARARADEEVLMES